MIISNEFLFILHTFTLTGITAFSLLFGKDVLVSMISLFFVLANIFVLKQITLLGYNATCADAFIIAISFGINLLQEYYGKPQAQRAIYISLGMSILYSLASVFHLTYIPAGFDTTQSAFFMLLSNSPRLIAASLTSYYVVQLFDTYTYGILKKITNGKHFVARNYFSMLTSQLFDTVLFSFLGLYGIIYNIFDIIIVSYCIKIASILLTTPFLLIVKTYIKKEHR